MGEGNRNLTGTHRLASGKSEGKFGREKQRLGAKQKTGLVAREWEDVL
jgi:hypothetical protein